jgi:hypothetical protein
VVEIDLDTADVAELTSMLVAANEQRQSPSGRVWFLLASSAENAPCLAIARVEHAYLVAVRVLHTYQRVGVQPAASTGYRPIG